MNKKLEKARKTLGKETLLEMEAMSPADLKTKIAEASRAMRDAADALEEHPGYQRAKADAYTFGAAKREVDKRQKAVVRVALSLLNS